MCFEELCTVWPKSRVADSVRSECGAVGDDRIMKDLGGHVKELESYPEPNREPSKRPKRGTKIVRFIFQTVILSVE